MTEVEENSVETGSNPAGTAPGGDGGLPAAIEFSLSDNVMYNDDLDEVVVPETPAAPAKEGAEAPAKPTVEAAKPTPEPAAKAGEKPPAPAKAAVESAKPAVEPARPAASPAGTAPDLSTLGPKELATELSRNRDVMISALAEQRFALSKEEKDALEVDAVATIPRLLARVYYDAVTSSLNNLATHVPRLVESVTSQLNTTNEAENAFYSKFSGIDRTNVEHQRTVNMAANIFRQQNPTATREQAIEAVGKMATVLLGIQPAPAPASTARNGAPRPFVPASGNARTVAAQPANVPKANPWDGLGVNFDEG